MKILNCQANLVNKRHAQSIQGYPEVYFNVAEAE